MDETVLFCFIRFNNPFHSATGLRGIVHAETTRSYFVFAKNLYSYSKRPSWRRIFRRFSLKSLQGVSLPALFCLNRRKILSPIRHFSFMNTDSKQEARRGVAADYSAATPLLVMPNEDMPSIRFWLRSI